MDDKVYEFKAIGYIKSCFKSKNGTPRQGSICADSKGVIELNKTFFNNPGHAFDGLDGFSHVWIFFYFHQNTNTHLRAKVKPPRLNGESIGVFASRSPHRPNALGLSLCKLDKVEGNRIYISGIDILDETPILDIKPFIYYYDNPIILEANQSHQISNLNSLIDNKSFSNKVHSLESGDNEIESKSLINDYRKPVWINVNGVIYEQQINQTNVEVINFNKQIYQTVKQSQFKVIFTKRSEEKLNLFHSKQSTEHNQECLIKDLKDVKDFYLNYGKSQKDLPIENLNIEDQLTKDNPTEDQLSNYSRIDSKIEIKCKYCLEYLSSSEIARNTIINILKQDPRSTYRRQKCSDRLHYLTIDTIHITCWYDEEDKLIEVVKIKPNYL